MSIFRMLHSTCWSHILHLVAEEIRHKLKVADSFISSMKSFVVKAGARRMELQQVYETFGFPKHLASIPVLTRWCTWLEAGSFHYERFEANKAWISETEENSAAIKTLTKLIQKDKLLQQLKIISDITPGLTSAIKTLEKERLAACSVWLQLKLVLGLTKEVFGDESEKLKLYLNEKHPALAFWKEIQFLDPRIASQFNDLEQNGLPLTLRQFTLASESQILPEISVRPSYSAISSAACCKRS